MSWGHDEYMHMVLRNHPGCSLPEEAFYVIRFHSFYPWHTGELVLHYPENVFLLQTHLRGIFQILLFEKMKPKCSFFAAGDYDYLCNDTDRMMMKWVQEFNKFDLYTKSETVPDIDELTPYYQKLIDKYVPGDVAF